MGGGFRVIDAFSRIVRLGEGVDRTGRISAGAMDLVEQIRGRGVTDLAVLRVRCPAP